MIRPIPITCDRAELVVECAAAAVPLSLSVEPELAERPLEEEGLGGPDANLRGVAVVDPPPAEALAALRACPGRSVLCVLSGDEATIDLAHDLGIVAVSHPKALLGILSLLSGGRDKAFAATLRNLADADRIRLAQAVHPERGGGLLARAGGGLIVHRDEEGTEVPIGEPRDAAEALWAMARAFGGGVRPQSILEGVEARAVHDVIFGPPRALSDPASKAALLPYGVPLPLEELCASPSRAAAEAARIGFPVRIVLASPDLRVWDHPDLAVDGVDNAARVRDVFRQLETLARAHAPEARVLGVTVTATSVARALLRVVATPLPQGLVRMELGFADPHGEAARDRTVTALPAPIGRIEAVLARLRGSDLILAGSPVERRATVEAIADVLLRVAAFVDDQREEVTSVEIDPLAVLLGGVAEVREACVTVGDAFVRSLEAGATG